MKNNIILGILLSFGISVLLLLLKVGTGKITPISYTQAVTTFLLASMVWFAHLALFYSKWYQKVLKSVWLRGFISVMLVAVVVFVAHRYLFDFDVPQQHARRHLTMQGNRILVWSTLYYFVLLYQRVIEQRREAEAEASRMRQSYLESQISSLSEQLSPHFMFNALNTLSAMVKEAAAQRFIEDLAAIYRYLLEYKDENVTTLERELKFMYSYWHIQKERFEDAISLTVDIEKQSEQCQIPPIVLQLLLENAIKHNVASDTRPLNIQIVQQGDYIVVENNVQPKIETFNSSKRGLLNISERYRLLFGRDIAIERTDKIFRVKLPLIKKEN